MSLPVKVPFITPLAVIRVSPRTCLPPIYTVAVGKGKDYTFQGAVDGLEINNQTVDFEPNGVNVTE